MKRAFIDTNLFIRYLTNDDPPKAERVGILLEQAASGVVTLVTTELVIAEVVWVLESAYRLPRGQIAALIRGILASPGVEVINGSLVSRAIELYDAQGIDFVDAYVASLMGKLGIEDVYSYDRKHIDKSNGVTRKEP